MTISRSFDVSQPIGYIDGVAVMPFFGAERGYNTEGDVLVNATADGVDLNAIWREQMSALAIFNEERTALAKLLSYPTTLSADAVPQSLAGSSFERASEFGIPQGNRLPNDVLKLGYTFEDYDLASRYTWKFLRDSTADQVAAIFADVLAADNKLVNTTILNRLFDPAPEVNEFGATCYGLYTGDDGITPLPYLGKSFPSTTTHYLASGASVIDSSDVEAAIKAVTTKGYGRQPGSKLLLLVNPQEGELVQSWRAGEESRPKEGSETAGPIAKHDFIPSASAPAYLLPDNIVGEVAPGQYGGLPVVGSYGPVWVIESEYIPAGYFTVVATSGADSSDNVIGVRQHKVTAYQGLRIIPGNQARYPLIDSYASRSFGVGVRHRGAAFVTQVTTGLEYAPPTFDW